MAIEQIRNGERGLSVRNKLNMLIDTFNTSGLGVGAANNIFGDTSGDVNAENLTVSPAANKAAAEGVRDTYFTANPTNLAAYDAQAGLHIFLLYTDNSDTVLEAQSRVGSAWVRSVALFAVQGIPGAQMSLSGLADSRVLFNNGGVLAAAPARVMSDGTMFIQGVTRIEAGTLAMGPFIQLSERGGFVGITNAFGDEFTFVDYRTPQNAASSNPRILAYTEAENNFDIQTVQTESLSSPITFNYTPTLLARTNELIGQVGTTITNLRFRIANAADTTQVLKYWPSEAAWLDDTGEDFNAGTMNIDFEDTELPLNQNTELQIDIRFDSGTLLGDTNGVPALTAVLQRGEFRDLAVTTDIPDGPGIVTLLQALTGNDRLDASAIKNLPSGVTLRTASETADLLETLSGNERLAASAIRDLPSARTDEDIRDVIVAMLTAGSNITLTEDDDANTLTISATGGGTTPPNPVSTDLRYGLSTQSDPALVDFATLTDVASPTDPITISTGTTSAGQYFHIFSSNTHDIQTIRDTVLDQIVFQEGGSGNIFTKVSDARTEGSVTYDAYTIGPLNAGIDEDYVLAFS